MFGWKSDRLRWVMLGAFSLVALALYGNSMQTQNELIQTYRERLEAMEQEKTEALAMKLDLELRISSQHDPAWIEMVLMRDLGVVPDGWIKVHFTHP